MLNYLWGGMLLVGILYGGITGNMNEVTEAALSSAEEAVSLCITMAGIVAMWVGLMEIARAAGLVDRLTNAMRPLLHFLFPQIPKEHRSLEYISANMIANFLGLGWAATPFGPFGLKAMEELGNLEEDRREGKALGKARGKGIAGNEMCTFLIINISSIQLIPVNIIAYRSQYGSVNPAAIVGPAIVATAVSTGVAIIFCRIMDRKERA